jgi:SRSO17 transposase
MSIPDFREVCKAVDSDIRAEFSPVFAQERTLDKAMGYVDALSDPLVRGNSWSIGEWCGHATPGPVQSLLGENKWDYREMWNRISRIAARLAAKDCENDPLGVGVIVDETAQVKRGMGTAGVGHQYAGCAGGVVNCVNWVFLTIAGPFMRSWVSGGLYIPEKSWFTGNGEMGKARRKGAGMPSWTRFATKPEIAMKEFRRLRRNGVKFSYAAGDEVYGRSGPLRGDHERNHEAYAYFVPRDFRAEIPGKGAMKLDDLLEHVNPAFEERSAGPGQKGTRQYEWALVELKSRQHYILIRRPCAGSLGNPGESIGRDDLETGGKPVKADRVKDEKITFCLCFIPPGSPVAPSMRNLVLMAGRRWAAEEGNETGKGPIGWDDNQLRKWMSLRKHAALAGLAMLRSSMIAGRLTSASVTGQPGETSGNTAGSRPEIVTGKAEEPGIRRPGRKVSGAIAIPVGDSIVPSAPGHEMPGDIGYTRLSRNEIMRLRNAVMSGASDPEIEFRVELSNWRRRHQAIAKWYHHAKRLSSAALASQAAGTAGRSRKVRGNSGKPGSPRPTGSHPKLKVGHSVA